MTDHRECQYCRWSVPLTTRAGGPVMVRGMAWPVACVRYLPEAVQIAGAQTVVANLGEECFEEGESVGEPE